MPGRRVADRGQDRGGPGPVRVAVDTRTDMIYAAYRRTAAGAGSVPVINTRLFGI